MKRIFYLALMIALIMLLSLSFTGCDLFNPGDNNDDSSCQHVLGDAVFENEISASCSEEGSYDIVIYCVLCKDEMSRTHKTISKLEHIEQHYNAKAPTCTEIGWDAYVTCKREGCGYSTYVEKSALDHSYSHACDESCNRAGCSFMRDSNHVFDSDYDNTCNTIGCGFIREIKVSEGLEFTSNRDGTCYVSGIGTCTDRDIIISNKSPAGDTVTGIGNHAFFNCKSLTSVTIGESVKSIGDLAFSDCDSLTSITVSENNADYKSIDGNLYSKDGKTLIQYAVGKRDTSFTIPDGVTSIGEWAFAYCNSLTSMTIPDNVTSIGSSAFAYCSSLTSVNIPDSVTYISYAAFASCDSLTSITIPDSVTSIGYGAFYHCDSLTSITIPDSVTSIGESALSDCTSLEAVYYGGSETDWASISIGDPNDELINATRYYYSETEPTIEGNFWHYVDGVPTIWPEYVAAVYSEGLEFTSNRNGTCYVSGIGTCTDTDIIIPKKSPEGDTVTSIGKKAFENCDSLTSITFEDPDGWYRTESSNYTGGTLTDLSKASQNARYFKSMYYYYYWYKVN